LAYPRQVYSILFDCAWQTLNAFGWNRKHLGAQVGATCVLHTWGANLSFHPHLHCIVPAGGVSINNKWKNAKAKGKFLFPVKAMSIVYRAKFLEQLESFFYTQGMDINCRNLKNILFTKNWVVYAKPPAGSKNILLQYLARYAHKIAITNHRILQYDNDSVTFKYSNYKHRNQSKTMRLSTWEFVRRFTLHILPKGFCKIRHYGILSAAWKNKLFPDALDIRKLTYLELWLELGLKISKCNSCKNGKLIYIACILPVRGPPFKIKKMKV